MGWFRNLFRGKEIANAELMTTLLKGEATRQETQQKRDELESKLALRKLELEMEHLEAVHEERRKDAAEKERLRQQRREWAKAAREKIQKKANGMPLNGSPVRLSGVAGCTVCADPSSPNLTADEIRWHSAGHPGAMAN